MLLILPQQCGQVLRAVHKHQKLIDINISCEARKGLAV